LLVVRILVSFAAHFEEITAGTLLVLMSLATFANVVARYFFNHPLEWAEEFSRYTFIWVVFLGAAVCSKEGRHIIIDGLVLALPARVRAILQVVVDAMVLGLMAILVHYGWILTTFTTQPTSTLKVPLSVVYVVVPLSALLIGLRSLGDFARHLRIAANGGVRR
jgi:TRAP-type C4-dicarboxylate transport system permease small subunit